MNEYIKALVIAEQQKIEFRKLEDLPSWPKAQELADLQARIDESTRRYEPAASSRQKGTGRHWRGWKRARRKLNGNDASMRDAIKPAGTLRTRPTRSSHRLCTRVYVQTRARGGGTRRPVRRSLTVTAPR